MSVTFVSHRPISPFSGGYVSARVYEAQHQLNLLGYGPLAEDGIDGPKTIAALRRFQSSMNLPVTGDLEAETVAHLERAVELELSGRDSVGVPPSSDDPAQPDPAAELSVLPDDTWRAYAERWRGRPSLGRQVLNPVGRLAHGVYDGLTETVVEGAELGVRSLGGLGVLGSDRFAEIGVENTELVDVAIDLAEQPSLVVDGMLTTVVKNELGRLDSTEMAQLVEAQVGRYAGRKIGQEGAKQVAKALAQEVLASEAGRRAVAALTRLRPDWSKIGGAYVTALNLTAEFGHVFVKSAAASDRLRTENPTLWRELDGTRLGGQEVQNLHRLWFVVEPLMDDVRAVVRDSIDAHR